LKGVILLLVGLALMTSCKTGDGESPRDEDTLMHVQDAIDDSIVNGYPREIYQAGFQKLYDKSKWFLYCIYCDKKLSFLDSNKFEDTAIVFGTLPLKYDTFIVQHDTVEIYFDFYLNGNRVDELLVSNFLYSGTVFVNNRDSIVLYTSRMMRYFYAKCKDTTVPCHAREVNPLQPDVKKYIQKNKEKIDPWFRAEAVRRRVIY
jgi:hypothetical protein